MQHAHQAQTMNARDDLDVSPTLPFNGAKLRDALRERLAVPSSPPLVPTRDSIPPAMIMAEEPLPLEPLPHESLSQPPLSQPPLSQPPLSQPPLSQPPLSQPPLSLDPLTDAPLSQAPLSLDPLTDAPLTLDSLLRPPAEARPRESVLYTPLRRARRSSSPPAMAPGVALRHPARALGRPSHQAPGTRAPDDFALFERSAGRLIDPDAAGLAAHQAARRAAELERRTTLMMLAGIGALLISLMALLR